MPGPATSPRPAVVALARAGLTARGVSYIVIGWIGLQIALGHHTQHADQRGALAEIAQQPLGKVLLWLLAIGFAAYALWRFIEAVAGPSDGSGGNDSSAADRAKSAGRGVVYASLCVSTVSFIVGASRQSQASRQQTLTGKVMQHAAGQWLVGLAGVAVIAFGAS